MPRVPIPSLPAVHLPFLMNPDTGGGRFVNPWGVGVNRGPLDVLRWKLAGRGPFAALRKTPPRLPEVKDAVGAWNTVDPGARVQWLGHASVLIELEGLHILIDPVFGGAGPVVPRKVAAPRLPDHLPPIDVILLTHGHYDHLDAKSVAAVLSANPTCRVVVPRGLGRALPRGCAQVTEASWWDRVTLDEDRGVDAVLVPAQHWHLRSGFDRNRSLWGGWFVRSPRRSIYHSGDTGHFGGFATIAAVLGKPDVAVLPLGAYEPRWFMADQHMSPEHSVAAFEALGATHMMGMHWGTFDLTDEPLDHGAFTLLPEIADERGISRDRLHVMAHGGVLGFGDTFAAEGRQP